MAFNHHQSKRCDENFEEGLESLIFVRWCSRMETQQLVRFYYIVHVTIPKVQSAPQPPRICVLVTAAESNGSCCRSCDSVVLVAGLYSCLILNKNVASVVLNADRSTDDCAGVGSSRRHSSPVATRSGSLSRHVSQHRMVVSRVNSWSSRCPSPYNDYDDDGAAKLESTLDLETPNSILVNANMRVRVAYLISF